MTMTAELLNYILAIIALISVLFTVWNKIKSPQMDSEKQDALLAQKVQWEREANEKKFADFGRRLEDAFLMASNHTNTVDTKVDKLVEIVTVMNSEIVKLSTIIEERIPKKNI